MASCRLWVAKQRKPLLVAVKEELQLFSFSDPCLWQITAWHHLEVISARQKRWGKRGQGSCQASLGTTGGIWSPNSYTHCLPTA